MRRFVVVVLILALILTLPVFSDTTSTSLDTAIPSDIIQRKNFWKRIYAHTDSSRTFLYNSKSLQVYAICNSDSVNQVADSVRKILSHPKQLKMKIGRKEFIQAAIARADSFAFVDDTLKKYGLHPDLKWLPVLESGYLDTMVSDQGALGIWQFIPSTGKRFGLDSAGIVDVYKSTSAFARYMTGLMTEFKACPLAVTAYHHGEKGVREKCKQRKSKELTSIMDLLGFQSRNYFAKYLSIIDIADSLHAVTKPSVNQRKNTQRDKFVDYARAYLGHSYQWGGRDTRKNPGMDCMEIIFRAYAKAFDKKWHKLSTKPSVLIRKKQLGIPVPGLDGIEVPEIDYSKLRKGDIVYLMLPDFELDDTPLKKIDGVEYKPWHMGIYVGGEQHLFLHADPGDKVKEQPIEQLFHSKANAIFVTRFATTCF